MRTLRAVLVLALAALLGSCGVPVLFQKTVPPPVVKEERQLEAERGAADLIARKIETPIELKPVAVSLSASLGAPKKSLVDVKEFDLPKASAAATHDLQAGIVQMQKQLAQLNAKLTQLQGKDIEGTGFSLLGPGMGVVAIGVVVLAIACPPVMTLMFFAFRRLKAAAGIVVNEMEKAADAPQAKEAVIEIKRRIAASMQAHPQKTSLLKNVITDLKG